MPRGVPSAEGVRQAKLETLRRHADKLRAKLAQIDAQTEAHDAERHRILGRVVEAHARQDPEFEAKLRVVLTDTILNKQERKLLGLSSPTRGRGRRAAGSQAGMEGPIDASMAGTGPTGPAEPAGG